MSDNGGAMLAAETIEGLSRLGIVHHTTLAESPEQNGKQENFWAQVEGRLMAMLEGEKDLTLELLNRATLAWLELEYNRKRHSEIGTDASASAFWPVRVSCARVRRRTSYGAHFAVRRRARNAAATAR